MTILLLWKSAVGHWCRSSVLPFSCRETDEHALGLQAACRGRPLSPGLLLTVLSSSQSSQARGADERNANRKKKS